MEMDLVRTDSKHSDFERLISELDRDLHARYGSQQAFFNQFNAVESVRNVVIAFEDGNAVGCGAFKNYNKTTCEIKRMFVLPESRGKKIGLKILGELERWAKEEGYTQCILETGKNQPEAIRLYQNAKYSVIPNYDQYAGVESSLCMQKMLL